MLFIRLIEFVLIWSTLFRFDHNRIERHLTFFTWSHVGWLSLFRFDRLCFDSITIESNDIWLSLAFESICYLFSHPIVWFLNWIRIIPFFGYSTVNLPSFHTFSRSLFHTFSCSLFCFFHFFVSYNFIFSDCLIFELNSNHTFIRIFDCQLTFFPYFLSFSLPYFLSFSLSFLSLLRII